MYNIKIYKLYVIYIRRHGSVKYIERYREIYDAREATVYVYASRRDASA